MSAFNPPPGVFVQQIPTLAGETHYTQLTTLEGTTYQLTLDFNDRESCWYLGIYTAEGDDIYTGIKLVCSFPLTRKCADPRLFQGEIWCISNTGDLTPAGLNDLGPGGRCTLSYFQSDLLP